MYQMSWHVAHLSIPCRPLDSGCGRWRAIDTDHNSGVDVRISHEDLPDGARNYGTSWASVSSR
ncbi:hypothetical protein LAUMK21_00238 [Mycobacterium pseudokansasii]|nr:hypothetical protein LAUMK21_00238 [Mycobacterium pseudokansasii]